MAQSLHNFARLVTGYQDADPRTLDCCAGCGAAGAAKNGAPSTGRLVRAAAGLKLLAVARGDGWLCPDQLRALADFSGVPALPLLITGGYVTQADLRAAGAAQRSVAGGDDEGRT